MADRYLTQTALADLADIPAQSRWIRTDGLRLHVLDYGGDNPPLLILPGITSPAITMDFVARRLTDLVRTVVLDIRGRGLSDSAPSYTLNDYAADAEAVITDLGLDRPLVLGHSMGARIAAVTAARGRRCLRGTIIVDPPLSGEGRGPYPTPLSAFEKQLTEAKRGTTADEVAQSWPRWPRREQEIRARWLSSCDHDAVAATHHRFDTEDFFHTWPHVPEPAIFLYGADSPVVTAAGANEAAQTNPAAVQQSIPGAEHMVYWDNPDTAFHITRTAIRQLIS
ncbi:alpha/beta hydrolase [Amycolatopsis sp.]|jgi:N-formylmaleamate deformylase|uniref:alpha/beta fold hydrolase n=1 Tax=Amycolatopsis sp. TaxID=37632 RepID=UPI002DFF7593|nr:alpha/beta hydrolase [Amycolatopsis sp.]